ncbi:MAG: HAD family hydrolase [Candidatus Kerfeldbacteria bacterium]
MNQKIKTIIYDFDGTIINTLPWHLRAYRESLKKLGVELSDKKIIKNCFNIIDTVAAKNLELEDVESFSKYYHQGARDGFKQADLHKNIIITLTKLNQLGYTVCLGSLGRRSNFDPALKRFDLEKYFKIILSYDECPHEKPIILQTLAKKINANPSEILIIGDAYNDIEAAKIMNSTIALYHPPEHEKFYSRASLQLLKPNFIIEDHLDIIKLLN